MQMQSIHKLIYDPKTKRWHAYEGRNYRCPLHCGDYIDIRVKTHYLPARIERDTQWYVIIEDLKFRLHPKQIYEAILIPF